MRWAALGGLGLVFFLVACQPTEIVRQRSLPPVSTGKVRVRVFTEPSPVKSVTTVGKIVFVATGSHVERWENDRVRPLSAAEGLTGNQIVAVASDEERRWVWIVTDGGIGYYDTTDEVFHPVPASAVDFAALAKEGASLAPARDDGAWLGSARGLVHVSARGVWSPEPIKEAITALARDRAGWLWVATADGLIARKPGGEIERIGAAHGCGIDRPRLFVEMPADQLLVIGTDENGTELIAIGKELAWKTYRALPDVHWDAAARRGDGAVVMGGGRVYKITPAVAQRRVRPLSRDGLRLVPLTSGTSDWVIDPLAVKTPPGALSRGAAGDSLLIGTRDLGTARFRDGDARPLDWLRRRPMFQDATKLSVACAKEQDCWIATGGLRAWRFTGDGFVPGGPDQVVLAVARDPAGPIYALHRGATDIDIRLSRIDGPNWVPVPKVLVTTPGSAPEINFARFASSGSLWVGLRYHDQGGELRAHGIAIIEPASGKVVYHPAAPDDDEREDEVLAVPIGIVDADVRGDTAYFVTDEGVARLSRGDVDVWTDEDGLQAELARAVTIAANGDVIVATEKGAARWDGKAWAFPPALRFDINDVVATSNGQVWMATERGIAAWDGKKLRRVDTRRGLAENHILDIAIDQYDRLWARGPGSLTLISQ